MLIVVTSRTVEHADKHCMISYAFSVSVSSLPSSMCSYLLQEQNMRSWLFRHMEFFRQAFMPLFHPRIQRVHSSRESLLIIVNFICKKRRRNVPRYFAQCTRFIKVSNKEGFSRRSLRWVRRPVVRISLYAKCRCPGKADISDATWFEKSGMSNPMNRVELASQNFKKFQGYLRLTYQVEIIPKLFLPPSCKNY